MLKIGLQMYAVREDFSGNPAETFVNIKKMGYHGVEFNYPALNRSAAEYKKMMDEAGLECLGMLVDWDNLTKEALPAVMEYCREVGTNMFIIGQVPVAVLTLDEDAPGRSLEYIKELSSVLSSNGFTVGYHSHDSDFQIRYQGTSFYEYVMDNTPEDFLMIVDTGNTVGGGGDPLALIEKYPGRTLILHIKGYSAENKYLTPVWENGFDLERILEAAVLKGGAKYMDIEFGARSDYIPMERAERSAKWLLEKTEKWR